MTEQELREKIVEVLSCFKITGVDENNECLFEKSIPTSILEEVADLLISAGCAFDNKHRVFFENVSLPTEYMGNECFFIPKTQAKIKQLYGNKEVDEIVKERDEYKHRAQVAEQALAGVVCYIDALGEGCGCCAFLKDKLKCKENCKFMDGITKFWKEKAENELQEERKDEQN